MKLIKVILMHRRMLRLKNYVNNITILLTGPHKRCWMHNGIWLEMYFQLFFYFFIILKFKELCDAYIVYR